MCIRDRDGDVVTIGILQKFVIALSNGDVVTIGILQKFVIALSNGTIIDPSPIRRTV